MSGNEGSRNAPVGQTAARSVRRAKSGAAACAAHRTSVRTGRRKTRPLYGSSPRRLPGLGSLPRGGRCGAAAARGRHAGPTAGRRAAAAQRTIGLSAASCAASCAATGAATGARGPGTGRARADESHAPFGRRAPCFAAALNECAMCDARRRKPSRIAGNLRESPRTAANDHESRAATNGDAAPRSPLPASRFPLPPPSPPPSRASGAIGDAPAARVSATRRRQCASGCAACDGGNARRPESR